jgi:hypothetical protein
MALEEYPRAVWPDGPGGGPYLDYERKRQREYVIAVVEQRERLKLPPYQWEYGPLIRGVNIDRPGERQLGPRVVAIENVGGWQGEGDRRPDPTLETALSEKHPLSHHGGFGPCIDCAAPSEKPTPAPVAPPGGCVVKCPVCTRVGEFRVAEGNVIGNCAQCWLGEGRKVPLVIVSPTPAPSEKPTCAWCGKELRRGPIGGGHFDWLECDCTNPKEQPR